MRQLNPIEPDQPEHEARTWWSRRWVWVVSTLAFLMVVVVAAGILVRVPYYAYSPGSVRPTASLISIVGADVHPPDGEVLLMTVSISRQRLTLFAALRGWLDPTVTVVEEEKLLGGSDRETTRQVNLQMMDNSKEVATYVALDRLGYEVGIEGSGAIITQVSADTPAEGVLERGDTVVAVDGEPVELASDLIAAISSLDPGTSVTLEVEPLGSEEVDERVVVLGAREDDPDAAFLGVVPGTRDGRFIFPFDVTIATGDVGGPSAGLSFTLTILDLLTPGELTGGIEVAATGTMSADGIVGPIGGLEQKAAAARRDGVAVFLVPGSTAPAELAAARRQAGDEVQIIEVNSLDEALDALVDIGGDPLPSVPPGGGPRS